MHSDEKEKTTFIIEDMNYMPTVDDMVYVNDMVAKMSENEDHCSDLVEIFE